MRIVTRYRDGTHLSDTVSPYRDAQLRTNQKAEHLDRSCSCQSLRASCSLFLPAASDTVMPFSALLPTPLQQTQSWYKDVGQIEYWQIKQIFNDQVENVN